MATGIDFGTTNSVIAQWNGDEVEPLPLDSDHLDADWFYPSFEKLFPSVVGQSSLRQGLLYGWEAKLRSQRTIEACKRMLKSDGAIEVGSRRFPATSVASGVFAAIRERADAVFTEIDNAVITVPANAKGGARYRTRAAANAAGIQVKALLNEPTAAALAYMHHIQEDGTIMVFDWGGGTIDVTILEHVDGFFHEKISHGITQLGGIEIDKRLRNLILGKLKRIPDFGSAEKKTLDLAIERTKIRLSTEESVHVDIPGGLPVEVTRPELEEAISDLVEAALQPARRCLNELGIKPKEVDDILMIGGTSQIPCVRRAVERLMDDETVNPELCDPMTAVAEGAAVAAALFDREIEGTLKVTSMYALGTTHRPGGRNGPEVFSPLIKAGSPLPAIRTKSYTPNADTARQLSIPVWEADPEKPLDDPENFQLTTLEVKYPRPTPRKEAEFELEYTYTEEGLLQVKATLVETGEILLDEEIQDFTHGGCPSTDEIRAHLRELPLTPPLRNAPRPAAPSEVDAPEKGPTTGRSFVVDGSNIAWLSKFRDRGEKPSLVRLTDAVRALAAEHPHASITVFVDPAFRHQIDPSEHMALVEAISKGQIVQVPAGTHGKADRSVVELAGRTNATVVTNDNYAELQDDHPWLLEEGRVLGAQYAGGIWMFLPRTPVRRRRI
ncbi:Hsp70 family protein [Actinomadura miaoliensis]|uniref:RNase NYN domain-containing protein n=1 Tax=Actinomadura miaoliensis TaxID=430685 RepID=A0ABP7W5J6_9ACTN